MIYREPAASLADLASAGHSTGRRLNEINAAREVARTYATCGTGDEGGFRMWIHVIIRIAHIVSNFRAR